MDVSAGKMLVVSTTLVALSLPIDMLLREMAARRELVEPLRPNLPDAPRSIAKAPDLELAEPPA